MIDNVSSLCPIDLIPFSSTPPNMEDYTSAFEILSNYLLLLPQATGAAAFIFNFAGQKHKEVRGFHTRDTRQNKAESR